MPTPPNTSTQFRVLIVVPGTVNYFADQAGNRFAEALRSLGVETEVCHAAQSPLHEHYNIGLLSQMNEVFHALGGGRLALQTLRGLRRLCESFAAISLDCVKTTWFRSQASLCRKVGIAPILDLGLIDQSFATTPRGRGYRFVFSGLTPSEQASLSQWEGDLEPERSIPWAFVGHETPDRCAMIDRLIQKADPRGFVYMPRLGIYSQAGNLYLNQELYERILRHSRYQVWRSHHKHLYMEPERFRASLLTGGLPAKIIAPGEPVPGSDVPFRDYVIQEAEAPARLRVEGFRLARERYIAEWRRLPSLAESLKEFLWEAGLDISPKTLVEEAA